MLLVIYVLGAVADAVGYLWQIWPLLLPGSVAVLVGGALTLQLLRRQQRRNPLAHDCLRRLDALELHVLKSALDAEEWVTGHSLSKLVDVDAFIDVWGRRSGPGPSAAPARTLVLRSTRCNRALASLWRLGLLERLPQEEGDSSSRRYRVLEAARGVYDGYLTECEHREEAAVAVGKIGPRSRSSALAERATA